jgi:hypothetical protein
VEYGATTTYGSSTPLDSSLVTSHWVSLSGLTSNTLYHYRVHSANSSGVESISNDFAFQTSRVSGTPPTVSLASPISGATLSGPATVTALASSTIGIASVQILLDLANLGSPITSSPYSMIWDSTTASNGAHSLTAVARDTVGNAATSISVTVTISNSVSGGSADFQTRCTAAGVVRCIGFDSVSDIAGKWGDNTGILTGDAIPVLDNTVAASGTSSLKFTVPSLSGANSSASYWANFSTDLSTQFGQNSSFYIQWRQRFSPEFLSNGYPGGEGWKQSIIGTGDVTGCNSGSTSSACSTSCSPLETVTQNTFARGFAQMYNSCTGSASHGAYDAFQQPFSTSWNSSNFKLQNAMPSPYCLYDNQGLSRLPPTGNCFGYFSNEWMTFQVHIQTGPWVNGEFTNSFVDLWIAREGQPSVQVIHWGPYNLTADPNSPTAQRFGKVWLIPYNTAKNPNVSYPIAFTWYDELIISTQRIADPK